MPLTNQDNRLHRIDHLNFDAEDQSEWVKPLQQILNAAGWSDRQSALALEELQARLKERKKGRRPPYKLIPTHISAVRLTRLCDPREVANYKTIFEQTPSTDFMSKTDFLVNPNSSEDKQSVFGFLMVGFDSSFL